MTSFLEKGGPSDGPDEENNVDLREYIGIVLEGWPWIVGFALIGLLAGLYTAWHKAPVYQADALVRIESQQPGGGSQQAMMFAQEFGPQISASAETAVLKSRSILGAAVDRVNLRVDAEPDYWGGLGRAIAHWRNGAQPRGAPFGLLDEYAWGGEEIHVSRLRFQNEVGSARFRLIAGDDGTYELRTVDGSPVLQGKAGEPATGSVEGIGRVEILVGKLHARPGTRFWVNYRSRAAALSSLHRRFNVRVGSSSSILDLTLKADSPAAAERQLDAIMAVYLEKNVEQQSEEATRRLEFLKQQLPELKQQRDSAEQRLREFQETAGLLDLNTEAQSLLDRISNVDQALEELKFKREELLRRYTAEHPSIEAVDSKIASLRNERQQLQNEIKQLPKAESQLLELRREVKVTNELYLQLLNQAQELEIARAGITGFVHIVDEAYSPPSMIEPQRVQITGLYVLVALVLGGVVVVAKNVFRVTLREPDQLEARSGLPVYATVPFSDTEKKLHSGKEHEMPLAAVSPEDLAVESLRSLRTSLQFALMESKGHCIAFSGPTPSCGKSFVASNTAILLAHGGKRTVLVEADLRRGRLRRAFGISRRHPGLSDCLSGQATLDEALVEQGGVHVLAAGQRPPNPAELLMSGAMSDLMKQLAERFDYVVMDLPPVLNVADASIAASYADALFLVVRSELSTLHDVQQARKRLSRDDIAVKGIVFNGFKPNRLRYGYARYGYYSYRYGSDKRG
ncbi:capsular exopolysaccharide family protein [Salinisphaera sp. PC39]|uniref:polysaccharide biosynthesis tyrosine autokinase n=1 Tax=Salinisphaera sp. PC39 TaxID=1304156 RepID=UPI00333EBDE3